MKKALIGVAAAAGAAIIILAGLATFRPGLLPNLGLPMANTGEAEYGLYCEEHGVPEKFCTLCHPELKEKLLLCPEHGNIPEDICTECHPENARKYDIKPCEHGLPAQFCPKCHPENFDGGGSASAGPRLIDDGWCAEFGERGPDGGLEYCKLLPMVRLASAELPGDVGLKTAPVAEEEHAHELTANAETAYDANRYAEVYPRVRGYVRETRVDLGHSVAAGEVLAVVDSSEVSTAKTQYLSMDAAYELASDSYRRARSLAAARAITPQEEIETRTALNQARSSLLDAEQRLRNLHFEDDELAEILATNDTRPVLEIKSPIAGTVILRHAVLGEAVEPTASLFTVANMSRLWLWIDVYEQDMGRVAVGQPLQFSVSGLSSADDRAWTAGRITWIGTEVDEKTRTTKVRAEIPNPAGVLRAHQYGKARIRIEEPHLALTVPKSAIQRHEGSDLVFLAGEGSAYRPQRIKARPIDGGDSVEVTWGLDPGQEVVTDGSFLLKTEIMKGSIGAGCCE